MLLYCKITVLEIKNLEQIADEVTLKIQDIKQNIADLNKNIPIQMFLKQQSCLEHTFSENHDDEANNTEEKSNIIVIDEPVNSKEIQLELLDEVDILQSDVKEGTPKCNIIEEIKNNEVSDPEQLTYP